MTNTTHTDNEALRVKRLNRNMRVREALYNFDERVARARAQLEEALRVQYPEGTEVRWADHETKGPWHTGVVLEWTEDSTSARVPVRNVITKEKAMITARQILMGGDEEAI